MKTRFGLRFGMLIVGLAITLLVGLVFWQMPDNSAQQEVVVVRQELRAQGFKTELVEFNFTTDTELRLRENTLSAANPHWQANSFHDYPNLMTAIAGDSALVLWQQAAPRTENGESLWPALREAMDAIRPQLDDACEAALSGPIRFNLDASGGSAMLLPHLAMMKNLAQSLGSRAVLELRDGQPASAWTNLLAETRLVTAWEVESVEISQLVRFAVAALAYNTTWQMLQTNGWTEAQLAGLQGEWEALDLFTNLPEMLAFTRAGSASLCQRDREEPWGAGFSGADFFRELMRSPPRAWAGLNEYWKQVRYRNYGTYVDEKNLLLFYRDRELELRHALQATNWLQMRVLPGVTNRVFFQSKYGSLLQSMMNIREIGLGMQRQGTGFLGRAAETESRRRILITALALERYRNRHGAYPPTLAALAPEFIIAVPVDYMDGQPLRYRLTDDGHFILYSVGLDGVDNGGKMKDSKRNRIFDDGRDFMGQLRKPDLIWPRPATPTQMAAAEQAEATAYASQFDAREEQLANYQWQQTSRHQDDAAALLGAPTITNVPDLVLHGHALSELLANPASTGTNRLSLCQLLTLRQRITGDEPEIVTFELPLAFVALTNLGTLSLMVDTNNDDSDTGNFAQQVECRGNETNGNTLLVWSTLYESPGLHAVQAWLNLNELPPDKQDCNGPWLPYAVTNFCQFSLGSATYDVERGATFHARLPEANGQYIIECVTTNGEHLKTLTGSTTNGEFRTVWNLVPDHGRRLTGETFHSTVQITLPDSGRTQTLRGP